MSHVSHMHVTWQSVIIFMSTSVNDSYRSACVLPSGTAPAHWPRVGGRSPWGQEQCRSLQSMQVWEDKKRSKDNKGHPCAQHSLPPCVSTPHRHTALMSVYNSTQQTQLATQDKVGALTCSARGSGTSGWWSRWRCRTGGTDSGKRPWQSCASEGSVHHHWPRQQPLLDPLTGTVPADGTHAERARVPGPASATGHESHPIQSQWKSLFWTNTVKVRKLSN